MLAIPSRCNDERGRASLKKRQRERERGTTKREEGDTANMSTIESFVRRLSGVSPQHRSLAEHGVAGQDEANFVSRGHREGATAISLTNLQDRRENIICLRT